MAKRLPSDRQGDGSRVYFEAVPNGSPCDGHMGIYYRDRATGETMEVDAGSGPKPEPAMIRATPDGRALYFVTVTSHSPEDQNASGDVYRWDAESDQYSCLTCVVSEAAPATNPNAGNGRFEPILVSDDFSHIYFTSRRQLVAGHGRAGDLNLYAVSSDQIGFVADLSEGEDGSSVLDHNFSMLSSDGNVLIFWQEGFGFQELTADRLADDQCRETKGNEIGYCQELFRYEDRTESLECLTCRPHGTTSNSLGSAGAQSWYDLSNDGSTIAFVTKERLLERDVNNTFDVYEWHNGQLGLISDGESLYPSSSGTGIAPKVYGMDGSGDNIFFTLIDPGLTGYEQDELTNLYDARVGGGFPRPQATPHCSEESCQGPLQAAPSQPLSGSSSFSGEGNLAPGSHRCTRGKVRHRGRCVARHRHRRHHGRAKQGNQRGPK
jgi:hypothetical protein